MPATLTYPGVYVEEIPSGVRTITGVATSIAAFIDFFKRGPMNKAVQILNIGDFEREFGGLDSRSEASYGIQQFFLNGGAEAWIVRTASGAVASADVTIGAAIPGAAVLTVTAISEGAWGNTLRVRVDHRVPTAGEFNLIISQVVTVGPRSVTAGQEVFRNLSMAQTQANFIETVINDPNTGSKLVRVRATTGASSAPLANGTCSGPITTLPVTIGTGATVSVTIGDGTAVTRDATLMFPSGSSATQPLSAIAPVLESAIRAAAPEIAAFAGATVEVVGNKLRILAGPGAPHNRVTFANAENPTASLLSLVSSAGAKGAKVTRSGPHTVPPTFTGTGPQQVNVAAGPATPTLVTLTFPTPSRALADIASALERGITALTGQPATSQARVFATADRLFVVSGDTTDLKFTEASPTDNTASTLKLITTSAPGTTAALLSAIRSGSLATLPSLPSSPKLNIAVGGATTATPIVLGSLSMPPTLVNVALALEGAIVGIGSAPVTRDAKVFVAADGLIVVSGDTSTFTFSNTTVSTAADLLLLTTTAKSNLQEYSLGEGGALSSTAQLIGARGEDGLPPNAAAIIGDLASKRGIFALEDVDLFNLLCIPRAAQSQLSTSEAQAVLTVAETYCEKRRAFFLMDTPEGIDDPQEIRDKLPDLPRHRNAALYYPRVSIPDPLNDFRLRSVGASGTIAGLYARTDTTRGVWKAPAGTEAALRNVSKLDDVLTDQENGTLNPLGINCLRNFKVFGNVSWGARTLEGADQQGSEWKYVPVRRVALFLEESLYRGTQFAVFEPNDEPLWSQIRLNIGAFMQNLFRQGAFQGKTPRDAYFVKCDKETTTQNDINLGIVNIVVGFAPLKPAEFVVIKLQQMAGQIAT